MCTAKPGRHPHFVVNHFVATILPFQVDTGTRRPWNSARFLLHAVMRPAFRPMRRPSHMSAGEQFGSRDDVRSALILSTANLAVPVDLLIIN